MSTRSVTQITSPNRDLPRLSSDRSQGATVDEHRDHRTKPGTGTSRPNSGTSRPSRRWPGISWPGISWPGERDCRRRPLLTPALPGPPGPPGLRDPGPLGPQRPPATTAPPAPAAGQSPAGPGTPGSPCQVPGKPPAGQHHPGAPLAGQHDPATPSRRLRLAVAPVAASWSGTVPRRLRYGGGGTLSRSARPDREQAEYHRLDLPPADRVQALQQPGQRGWRGA
jgi:hypothetical protein